MLMLMLMLEKPSHDRVSFMLYHLCQAFLTARKLFRA